MLEKDSTASKLYSDKLKLKQRKPRPCLPPAPNRTGGAGSHGADGGCVVFIRIGMSPQQGETPGPSRGHQAGRPEARSRAPFGGRISGCASRRHAHAPGGGVRVAPDFNSHDAALLMGPALAIMLTMISCIHLSGRQG